MPLTDVLAFNNHSPAVKTCTELIVYPDEVAGTLRFLKKGPYGFSITREVTELIEKFTNVCGINLRDLLCNIQNHPFKLRELSDKPFVHLSSGLCQGQCYPSPHNFGITHPFYFSSFRLHGP